MGLVCINGWQGGALNAPWEERHPRLGLGPSVSLVIAQHLFLSLSSHVQYEGDGFHGLAYW